MLTLLWFSQSASKTVALLTWGNKQKEQMLKRIRKAPKESGARTCLPLRLNITGVARRSPKNSDGKYFATYPMNRLTYQLPSSERLPAIVASERLIWRSMKTIESWCTRLLRFWLYVRVHGRWIRGCGRCGRCLSGFAFITSKLRRKHLQLLILQLLIVVDIWCTEYCIICF